MSDAGQAVIVGAEIGAGHDGQAELVLSVRHENGVIAPVVLDAATGFRLMGGRQGGGLAALVGRPWRDILADTILGDQ
jgi:hypothetical protein